MPSESEEDSEIASEAAKDLRDSESTKSRLDTFGWALVRWWGVLFRTIFISLLGVIGYFWFDPEPIGDVPFAELTLNQIFRNLFAFLVAIGCIAWFFNFPDQSKAKMLEDNPYVAWGRFGGWVVLVAMLAFYWLSKQ